MANEVGNVGGGAMTGAGLGTMIMPGIGTVVGAAGGGLLGLIKSILDGESEKKDRMAQATTTRYSPWTGLRAREVERTNTLGNVMAGLAGGAQLGQGVQKASADNALTSAIAAKLQGPAQAGQQQGASAPIVTPQEAGRSAASAPAAVEALDPMEDGGDLEKIMKVLRVAQGNRRGYGTVG